MTAIAAVLQFYFPHWEPPEDRREWNACLCPAHDEDRPSCAVNYEFDAVKCLACGFKGNVVSIIRRKEGLTYAEAVKRAEEILGGSYEPIPQKPARKSRRRVFGESETDGGGSNPVSARVRSRTAPWS